MSQAEVSSWPPPVPGYFNYLMDSPTTSQYSPDTSDAGSSPGICVDRHVDEDRIPPRPRDPALQAYFLQMEKSLRTCHPAALRAEAENLTRDILAEQTDVASSIRSMAEKLAKAGCRKVEYSRSCAFIAHEVFCQLQSTSHDASISFRDFLVSAVMKVFGEYYHKANLWRFGGLNGLTIDKEERINVVAFIGDLVTLDLIPIEMAHDHIISHLAYPNEVSTVHCRALYLFLLHAKGQIVPSLGLDVLGGVRRQLVRCTRRCPMSHDKMAQHWVIECCTVIERTIEQYCIAPGGSGKPGAVSHEWDTMLSKDGWFSALLS